MIEILKGTGFIRGTDAGDIARLDARWYYNWWYCPENGAEQTSFIPMIWSHRQVRDEILDAIHRQTPPAVLTWNEPSLITQAALPLLDSATNINEVMGYWARIYEAFRHTSIRIGSPAPAPEQEDQRWARQFLIEAKRREMCPDFAAIHYYCRESYATKGAADYYIFLQGWRDWLNDVLKLNLPIWITEYGCINGSKLENRRFMESTFEHMLGNGKYRELQVERYCWFANRTFHPVFQNSALIDSDGSLTDLGIIYRAAPQQG